jgi:adenine-specific DNA-methyltransferase
MDKMKFESPDMTVQNIEKIAILFPNCITETMDEDGKLKKVVNFKLLRQMLSDDVIDGDEAYEFTWVGKKAAIVEANKPIRKTLRPYPEESRDWDTTENLYIEGDNLEVLKLLQESYLGKVKMIYIDPPYNTGNDFIYRDDFALSSDEYQEQMGMFDEETGDRLFKNTDSNGRFHSDWCSMIYSRLMLARNLLTDDGIIFISIDDNEQENLKKLCDEVFASENFVATFIWNTEGHTDNQFLIKVNHEYILAYAKNIQKVEIGWVVDPNTRKESNLWKGFAENSITKNGEKNPPVKITLKKGFPCKVQELFLPSNCPCQEFWSEVGSVGYITRQMTEKYNVTYPIRLSDMYVHNGCLMNDVEVYSGWANSDKLKLFIANDFKKIEEKDGNIIFYLSDRGVIYYKKERDRARNIVSVLKNMGTTEQMRYELENQEIFFSYPKSKILMEYLIKIGISGDSEIIMDFFSGSATTAHAVMQLNAKDGGHRKFIMVQLPEQCDEKSEAYKAGYRTICDIGKERIRRAGDKIKTDSPLTTQDLDTGFRVFKLDETNMTDVYYSPNEYSQGMLSMLESNVKPDRTDLDLLFGCILEWGLPLSLPYNSEQIAGCTVHNYNDGDLIACFDENIPDSVIKEIAKKQPLRAVFRDSSFANSPSKINVGEIFKLLAPDTSVKVI